MEIKFTKPPFFTQKEIIQFIMRTFIFLFCTTVFSFSPGTIFSQRTKITIDADKTVTIDEIFELISKQSDYVFVYQADLFKNSPKVRLKKGVIKASKLLEESLSAKEFSVELIGTNTIGITQKTVDEVPQGPIRVSGKVTDEAGLPLAGITVRIAGTNRGTATTFDGNYTLVVPGIESVLVFTGIGFAAKEIVVGDQNVIDVVMQEAVSELDEVVLNAGYYNVSEREKTGNISKVTAVDIEKQPINNPLAAIQGRMPGVYIVQSTGVPGGEFQIQIRGQNSLRTRFNSAVDGNNPLYVIDGVPFTSTPISSSTVESASGFSSPLNNINPQDIASIEVLKDADATAIYGSRGANGVLLITTKKGKEGKTQFNVHMQTGMGRASNKLDLLTTPQYLEMREEAFANDGITPDEFNAPDLLIWDRNRFTDWQDELTGGTAYITNVQTSVSGGNAQTTFRFGGGFRKETTVFPGDFTNKKASGLLNINHSSIDKRFNASVSATFVKDTYDLPIADFAPSSLRLPPNAPAIYDENGDLNWENNTWDNPFASLEQKYTGTTENLIANATLGYEVATGLFLKAGLGYNTMNLREISTTPLSAFRPSFRQFFQRSATANNSSIKTWITEPQLEYKKTFGKGKLSILIGGTIQETVSQTQEVRATGFNSDALLKNLQAAPDISVSNSRETEYRYRAFFGRINYSHDEKYILNLTARRDGSSRFGPGRQFANFGAIGAAWLFSNERLIKTGLPFLSYGKLRGSYGTTGNDQIGNYQFLNLWRPTFFPYQNVSGLTPTSLFNADFGWETNTKFELALELGFLQDRILFNTSYFLNSSGDQLVGFPLPGTTGFTSIQSNLPATVQNQGFEFELNTKNILNDKFDWSTSINLSVLRNKLVEFPNIEDSPFANVYTVGEPLSVVKGFKGTGVDPETGLYTFEDLNDDGLISFSDDLQDIGNLAIDFFGGIQNRFQFGNFGLDFFFQFVKQTGRTAASSFGVPGRSTNQLEEVLQRWQNQGDQTNIQRYVSGFGEGFFTYENSVSSDLAITDASFIRLRSLSLSYDIPIRKEKGLDLQLYLQGQNLFTITGYNGQDPEKPGSRLLANLRQYTIGLQLNF